MVKHNNVLPNVHFRKHWQKFVKTWFNQAGRKKRRRITRQKKAAKNGLRPVGLLRPVVHSTTIRYNMKLRLGRGFTLEELKGGGVSRKFARTIGLSVDHRRKNRCTESLNTNVNRLKTYLSKLVVFPRKKNTAKKGIAGIPDDTLKSKVENLRQLKIRNVIPIESKKIRIRSRAITDEDKKFKAYSTLRKARKTARDIGKEKKPKE